jgi:hypothetical protein
VRKKHKKVNGVFVFLVPHSMTCYPFGNRIPKRDQHWYLAVGPKPVWVTLSKISDKNRELVAFQRKPTSPNFKKEPNSGFMICYY